MSRIYFDSLPPVVFYCVRIPYLDIVDLGIISDRCLTRKPHVDEVSRKVLGAYFSLRRLYIFLTKNLLPSKTKNTLAQSIVCPILDLADVC